MTAKPLTDVRRDLTDLPWIDMEPEEFYLNPKLNLQRLYRNFVEKFEANSRDEIGQPGAGTAIFSEEHHSA
jgi:hypothetical protein